MNYEQLAIDLARGRAAMDIGRQPMPEPAETHWNFYDERPDRHGMTVAACGKRVQESAITGSPTCQTCQEVVEAYEAMEF